MFQRISILKSLSYAPENGSTSKSSFRIVANGIPRYFPYFSEKIGLIFSCKGMSRLTFSENVLFLMPYAKILNDAFSANYLFFFY